MINLLKKHINLILQNQYVEQFLIILILLNIFVFIFETDKTFYSNFYHYITNFELFSIIIFSLEYSLRILTLNKVKDLFKPLMVVDLLAILPFYLSFTKINTVIFRALRLCRLLRIAKLTRYTTALTNIKRAFLKKKDELTITALLFFFALTVFSILIFYAEHDSGQKTFNSIPSSFWWGIVTFTSVGYGDICPVTTIGKIIASFAAILGICFNGLFIGILGSAFLDAIEHKKNIKEKHKENNEDSLSYEKTINYN